jgi:hypothetical protein
VIKSPIINQNIKTSQDKNKDMNQNNTPRRVNLVCDCTFFRKRSDKDGLIIFLDSITSKVLWYKFISLETKEEYIEGLNYLKDKNFEIQSVTVDGKKGIIQVFRDYPCQTCQFHLQAGILRKTTLNPQSILGQKLKYIATHFINERWTNDQFQQVYNRLTIEYKEFLNEKNDNNQYLHRNLRSAMFGIKLALPYLFTNQKHQELKIPNTTNHIDGGLNPKLKELVRIHRGMKIQRRNKLIQTLLINHPTNHRKTRNTVKKTP